MGGILEGRNPEIYNSPGSVPGRKSNQGFTHFWGDLQIVYGI